MTTAHTDPAGLAGLLSTQAPELPDTELPPDGRYQLTTTTVRAMDEAVNATLRAGFRGRPAEDFPTLVVGWGRCRVGSTAITNLFGIAGVPAYYQPVKTIARYELTGGTGSPFVLPDGETALFAKEMAGPYLAYECLFNPIRNLIESGWPADRLRLLVLDREPVASMDSWMAKWEERIGRSRVVDNFLLATANYPVVRRYAESAGVQVTHFPYEASRQPETTVARLFGRLGLSDRYRPDILTGWGAAGDLNSENALVRYPAEPEAYVVPGIHGNEKDYRFRQRTISRLTEEEQDMARAPEVRDRYLESVARCCDDLGIGEPLRAELFG
ncbi:MULTISPECIES: hypothetical protein [unclassified Streptomyces]|uniref:hypothetical protein n=1 Tax=unclassified Streptomyces TaxID=2593676 RepID=UPI002E2A0DE5|nr:hypothetical protein [Streptomyces sp. NBC_00223]